MGKANGCYSELLSSPPLPPSATCLRWPVLFVYIIRLFYTSQSIIYLSLRASKLRIWLTLAQANASCQPLHAQTPSPIPIYTRTRLNDLKCVSLKMSLRIYGSATCRLLLEQIASHLVRMVTYLLTSIQLSISLNNFR